MPNDQEASPVELRYTPEFKRNLRQRQLPACGLVEHSVRIAQRRRELRRRQARGLNRQGLGGGDTKVAAGMAGSLARVQNYSGFLEFLADNPHWLLEVRVVRNDHRRIVLAPKGI
jgi:hypothetical protein